MACLSWSWLNWARDKASGVAWSSLDPAVGETRDRFATGDVIDQAEPSHQRLETVPSRRTRRANLLGGSNNRPSLTKTVTGRGQDGNIV